MSQSNSPLGGLFKRRACPLPTEKRKNPALQLKHGVPLLGFVVPTVVIGYGFVIPKSCIAGVNELTIGFATTILGACVCRSTATAVAMRPSAASSRRRAPAHPLELGSALALVTL